MYKDIFTYIHIIHTTYILKARLHRQTLNIHIYTYVYICIHIYTLGKPGVPAPTVSFGGPTQASVGAKATKALAGKEDLNHKP